MKPLCLMQSLLMSWMRYGAGSVSPCNANLPESDMLISQEHNANCYLYGKTLYRMSLTCESNRSELVNQTDECCI